MSRLVLLPLQRKLETKGFVVRKFAYPSWKGSLEGNVRLLSKFVNETSGSAIHIVAHSLGGLIALKMLLQDQQTEIRRLVLLGTPYAGCHCGKTLADSALLSALVGHSLKEWLMLPRANLIPDVEIGVIAGTLPLGLGRLIPGLGRPNDGVVALDETYIKDAQDSIALPVNHSGMLVSKICAEHISSFLRTGNFIHA